ncbi:MAG: DUF4384 domain-containing protein [Ectothiorhodospiraceae bacterium]|nr:DUF4384 domain-containing protein [Ectothiorhodospiraceae bacterium]
MKIKRTSPVCESTFFTVWKIELLLIATMLASAFSLSVAAETETSSVSILQVSITTHLGDEQHFRKGDEISLLVNLNHDAYVLLIYQDSEGHLVKMYPVSGNDDGLTPAGRFIAFPRRSDGVRLIVSPPYGEEHVWAFVSNQLFPKNLMENATTITDLKTRLQNLKLTYSESSTTLFTYTENP